MGLPKKEIFFKAGVVALAMNFLTACETIKVNSADTANTNDKDLTETSQQIERQNPFSSTIDEALNDAEHNQDYQGDKKQKISPPFYPERQNNAEDSTTTDSTQAKSPFSDTIEKALDDAKKAEEDPESNIIPPPFFPDHDEPEGP